MKKSLLIALLVLCSCGAALAGERTDYPRIAFCGPGGSGTPIDQDQYILLVLEGPAFSHDATMIPENEIVPLVNSLLEAKGVSYVAVHVREGTKYGELVRGIDLLRGTKAKNIGFGMRELPQGRNP